MAVASAVCVTDYRHYINLEGDYIMKKFLALLLALVMCVSAFTVAYAADVDVPNEAETTGSESMVGESGKVADDQDPADKASANLGDMIRFIPLTIDVSYNKVVVDGYFVNLSTTYHVGSFRDVTMDVYEGGSFLIGADFGTIHDFTLNPLSSVRQSFAFNGWHNLNYGSYSCGDDFYCVVACTFSKW
jgi:hypothetical protein